MDFKYIEQLLERYFAAETTLQEERILREFFCQEGVPEHLRVWQALFRSQHELANARLDEAFDERVQQLTGEVHVHAKRITLSARLRPLYRVAVCLALVAALGVAVERPLRGGEEDSDATAAEACVDELDPDGITPLDIRSAEVASKGLKSLSDPLMVADSAALP